LTKSSESYCQCLPSDDDDGKKDAAVGKRWPLTEHHCLYFALQIEAEK
jgi:hypothetical protein